MAYQRGLRGGGMRSKDQFYYLSSGAPGNDSPTMGMPDAAGEWRIAEHYRNMSDGELIVLARQKSALTAVAQQALRDEISNRRLIVPPEEPTVPKPEPGKPTGSPYDEDRQLGEICTVWSLRDALQLQALLDRAGIPFFMGPEKATGVDAVTSNFANGIGVQVMRIGWPWASEAMQSYEPADDQTPQEEKELRELPVRCPKCHSTEVVFKELVPVGTASPGCSPAKFHWVCDSCGREWEDDGIVKER